LEPPQTDDIATATIDANQGEDEEPSSDALPKDDIAVDAESSSLLEEDKEAEESVAAQDTANADADIAPSADEEASPPPEEVHETEEITASDDAVEDYADIDHAIVEKIMAGPATDVLPAIAATAEDDNQASIESSDDATDPNTSNESDENSEQVESAEKKNGTETSVDADSDKVPAEEVHEAEATIDQASEMQGEDNDEAGPEATEQMQADAAEVKEDPTIEEQNSESSEAVVNGDDDTLQTTENPNEADAATQADTEPAGEDDPSEQSGDNAEPPAASGDDVVAQAGASDESEQTPGDENLEEGIDQTQDPSTEDATVSGNNEEMDASSVPATSAEEAAMAAPKESIAIGTSARTIIPCLHSHFSVFFDGGLLSLSFYHG
jgi:hypothetical protein